MGERVFGRGVILGVLAILVANAYANPASRKADRKTAAEPFKPTWESLTQYQTPEWFRDAKFGIWAHWGPQCEPEKGDWYAHGMYQQGSYQYNDHLKRYGPDSQTGFMDIIHQWKAEHWDPDKLVALYKRAGAQYFVALANHHDNFDNYDSKYQPWNSVNMGPRKDIIGGWAKAAHKAGLRFGVSVHAAHAWQFYEPAQGADTTGPYAGIPYDGTWTKADGKGKWWDGLDPQDLYAQNHAPSPPDPTYRLNRWDWGNGASVPDAAYCEKFYNRTVDLVDKYKPDLLYFDDTALPLWPISDVGLKLAAHYYNQNIKDHHGRLEGVINGKVLDEQQRKCMVWDIERGQSNTIEPLPWQTDTCIGDWHYNVDVFNQHRYKTAKRVIQTLADVVSKNGNLLLSIPVKGDGTLDSDELAIVEGIASWMDVNKESLLGTRPWKVFGEGPASDSAKPLAAQGFNEGTGRPFGPQDVRFTQKGNAIYAIVLGMPTGTLNIHSLIPPNLDRPIKGIRLLGSRSKIRWAETADGLEISAPTSGESDVATVFKISLG